MLRSQVLGYNFSDAEISTFDHRLPFRYLDDILRATIPQHEYIC